jgi:Bacterial lipid A biosynthesis acyltransferase
MPKLEQALLWAEWALVRTAAGLLRLLPIDVGASLAASLVSWAAPWTAFHRRALRNFGTAFPDWSEGERERVAAAMWRNTGRTFAETLQLDRIFSNCSRIEMTGYGALEQCLREPGGNVGVTLHMGNWEIVSFAVGLCGGRVAGVHRPLRNPYLDRYVRLIREPFYPRGLLGKGRARGELPLRSVAIAAKKLLRNAGHLGLGCGQIDNACASIAVRISSSRSRNCRSKGCPIGRLICPTRQRRSHDNSNTGYAMRPSNGCGGKGGRYPDRVPDATHARAMHAGI